MASVRPGRHIAESLFDRKSPGARAAGIARTKWIDDQAAAALETATQLKAAFFFSPMSNALF
jgi:hypothetical protein